jgi:hypothetical protein
MSRFIPVRNVRRTDPHCCSTCAFLVFDNGSALCQRPDGPEFDTGDQEYLYTVCDLWRSQWSAPLCSPIDAPVLPDAD